MNHQDHQDHQAVGASVDRVAKQVIDAGLKVHRALGPGLLESAYEHCLAHELGLRGLPVRRQVPMPVTYDGMELDAGYRLDLVVINFNARLFRDGVRRFAL
ncbi:conserved hypothetical protein [Phenylobacterium zucineum HLK1]|uniref:GxxExxY protein n=1 Tax=Phenylobacterium zucineum (strain HLK1) TaxID=450851 RepID=B4R8K0_PHEZH|nr:GxxExxY protein [Phenylobacterium zucineum]ACG77627.1 conserved hypothetical protein [Phenylobacterium zucineum HLK1]